MAYDIGPKLGIDGEAEFRKAIQNINTNIRTLGTEMLAVTSAYDKNDKSAAALTSRNEVLVKQIDAQKEKLAKLQEGLAASRDKYGEADEKTQRWQQTVNKATADLNQMERQLQENTRELEGNTGEVKENTDELKNQGSALDGLKPKLSAFGSGLASAAKAAAASLAAVTAAAGAMVGAVVTGVSSVAEYGDNIDKMSQKLGMSAEAYQEWDFIMQHCGTSIESMQSSMKTLASAAEKGNDSFSRLGMSQEAIANMSQEDLFSATIAALQNVSDETERTYLAGQLLGKGATELGPLLNTSAQDVDAMRQQVHELGGVMSNESVAAAAAFQDSLQNLQTGIQGMGRGALADFLPSITQIMDGLTALVSGDDSGLALISQGLDDFTANLSSVIPTMLETGSAIVQSLLGAITENLPRVIESGAGVLMEFASGVLGMLPQVAAAALEIIMSLAGGISESLPELIPVIVDVVIQIVETLINNVDMLIDAAVEIVLALADGLINALPKLLEKAPEIIDKLVLALAENLPKILEAGLELVFKIIEGIAKALPELILAAPQIILSIITGMAAYFGKLIETGAEVVDKVKGGFNQKVEDAKQWGKDLIQNFIDGIKAKWNALKETVSSVAQTVKNFLGFSEPEEGPLSNFHTYAPDMMKLFAQGIAVNVGIVQQQLDKSLNFDFGAVQRNIKRSMEEVAWNAGGTVRVEAASASAAGVTGTAGGLSPDSIVTALRQALEGMDVYLDGSRVGQLVSNWQRNDNKAWAR